MKNITISVGDDLYRLARIKAAERSTTVTQLLREYMQRLTERNAIESEFNRLEREEQELREELRKQRISLSSEQNLTRDELHSRHAIH